MTKKNRPRYYRDCIKCHTPVINPDLTRYAGVSEVAHAGGASYPRLIRVSHIHLFGYCVYYQIHSFIRLRGGCQRHINGDLKGMQILLSVYQMWFYAKDQSGIIDIVSVIP